MKKAMIAMSGGVDSSVAAWLMKRDGYDCMGVTMRLFAGEDSCERKGHTCCSLDDVEDARSVARQLGIPYFVFNFTEVTSTEKPSFFPISRRSSGFPLRSYPNRKSSPTATCSA